MIRVDHGHDASASGRTSRRLDGNVDGLPTPTGEDRVVRTGRDADHSFGQRGTLRAREVVIADVEGFQRCGQRSDHIGVAVPQVVDPTVEVDVDEFAAVHVPDVVALPAADHQVDTGAGEKADAVTAHVALSEFQGVLLRR